MAMSDSEAKKEWMKNNSYRISVKLMTAGDADIINFLNACDNKNGFIRAAIRDAIEKEKRSR